MPENDATRDRDLLIHAAREAGKIASGFFGGRFHSEDKPDGAGPVTEADLSVNVMLEETLQAARPGYGWLSEESEDSDTRLARERVFVIDPLDGTRSFINGDNTWAHSMAVVENGVPVAAAVYLPMLDRLYAAAKGQGATLNGAPLRASSRSKLTGATVLCARPALQPQHWKHGKVPGVIKKYRPSLAYRLALVAEGRYDAMLTLRDSWEWDIAAGALLLEEAGAIASDRKGGPLRFNNAHPQVNGVVAAGAGIHGALVGALA
ncbi:3'(2'),5'-bisphosphate nucleotidase CysQ [Alisedimentitalea sp. MJ-SS2]|uniref:inositol monophosphatase family protein n=1 Tax=Aliisedimentitalea sp. MJ-SS2 TaxID=3049795 RepID=UPI00290E0B96|nr:3'(2'),5'-bisphosphate nucleotidase CysQ [Alisedimentitalea sp. MJ-SS2]MDU8927747.1 3'(2'),5'-bisphosphate nucleotidase CysQ [Alisedimentitalea sp. MJ-SS2]